MADIQVPSIATVTPAAADTVVGVQGGAVKRFAISALPFTQAGTGAVARTMLGKAQEAVSVKDFGAVGDGVSDDTAAIQAALDAMGANSGGEVFVPPGVYGVSATLTILSNVTLRGVRGKSKIIALASADYSGGMISATEQEQVVIRDMVFDGNVQNRASAANALAGVFLNACQYSTLAGCLLTNLGKWSASAGNAITLQVAETSSQDCSHNVVRDCIVSDADGKVQFGMRLYTKWTENIAADAYTRFVRDNIIDSVHFVVGCGWNNIELVGPATVYNTVSNCRSVGHTGFGAFEADKGASYNTFSNCTVSGQTSTAPMAFRASGEVGSGYPDRVATGNIFSACIADGVTGTDGTGAYAFYVVRAASTIIRGCRVNDVSNTGTTAGFVYESYATDLTIADCIVSNTVYMYTHVGGTTVAGLMIVGCRINAERGINLANASGAKSNIVINGNSLSVESAAAGAEAAVDINNATFVIVSNNIIRKTSAAVSGELPAVRVISVNNCQITGNIAENFPNTYNAASADGKVSVVNNIAAGGLFNTATNNGTASLFGNVGSTSSTTQPLLWATAAPSAGTWGRGAMVMNQNAAASGFVGWVCTSGGTPGTWKTFGAISA